MSSRIAFELAVWIIVKCACYLRSLVYKYEYPIVRSINKRGCTCSIKFRTVSGLGSLLAKVLLTQMREGERWGVGRSKNLAHIILYPFPESYVIVHVRTLVINLGTLSMFKHR